MIGIVTDAAAYVSIATQIRERTRNRGLDAAILLGLEQGNKKTISKFRWSDDWLGSTRSQRDRIIQPGVDALRLPQVLGRRANRVNAESVASAPDRSARRITDATFSRLA